MVNVSAGGMALSCDNCCSVAEVKKQLTMVVHARHPEMDYALLQCDTDHAYLSIYNEPPAQLLGADFDLTGYCIGIETNTPMFSRRLGFTKADAITISNHNNHIFLRSAFAGYSNLGSAFILKDGCLVGIYQEGVNALRERLRHAKLI